MAWQENMRNLCDSGKYLFNNEEMSDVKFVFKIKSSKGNIIYAHSFILSMMSSIFQSNFENNFREIKEIKITNKTYDDFYEFLRFLYTNQCNITKDNAFEIMELAKTYSLQLLMEDCSNYIISSINEETSCETLAKSIKIGHKYLTEKASNFIGKRISRIVQTDGFLEIDKETLRQILIIEEIGPITEVEIFSAAIKWASHKCKLHKLEVNGENKRNQLGDLLKLIRFPTMTSEEFSICIKGEDGLLTSDEKLALLMCTVTKESNNYGFNNERRFFSKSLFEVKEIFLMINCENQKWELNDYEQISHSNTIFLVKTSIYLTKISIAVSEEEQNATIQILDDTKLSIAKQTFNIKKNSYWTSKWLTFLEPILIEANREYNLMINYQKTTLKYYCVDRKILPWIERENQFEFKFNELSQFLIGIKFKPFS